MYCAIAGTNVRVMGALHLFPGSIKQLPRWASDAVHWADNFALELDRDSVGSAFEVAAESSCQAMVSHDTLARIESVWPNSPQFPPLNVAPSWLVALYLGAISPGAVLGVEHFVIEAARSNGRVITYLETPQEFAANLGAIPAADVELGIEETLDDFLNNARRLAAMYGDWQGRKLTTLYRRLHKKTLFSNPATHDGLLVSRNRAWVPHIEALCAMNAKTLIVVGALHLCGEDNLLSLLGRDVTLL